MGTDTRSSDRRLDGRVTIDISARWIMRKAKAIGATACKNPILRHYDADDISQHLLCVLQEKKDDFDPDRGSVRAFVNCVLHYGTSSLIRREDAEVRSVRREELSLDALDPGSWHDSDAFVARDDDADQQDRRIDMRTSLDSLSDKDAAVARELTVGSKYRAHKELCVGRREIDRSVQRIHDRLKDHGMMDYCDVRATPLRERVLVL